MSVRIYVDVDDILCETAVALAELAEREFSRRVPYEKIGEFNLQNVFKFSDDEMRRFIELAHSREMLLAYRPTPGAIEGVRAMREAGAQVDILTGRPASCHQATREWLDRNGLADFDVSYVDKYGRYHGRKPGDPMTVSLPDLLARHYDFAIDDSPVILKQLKIWHDTKVLVFDRPWNRNFTLAKNMTRACGWSDIISELSGTVPIKTRDCPHRDGGLSPSRR